MSRSPAHSAVLVAEVDNAETVAVRGGQHAEVRVVWIAVPVNPLSSQRHQARRLRGLLGRIGHVQVQVQARVFLRRCLATLQRDLCPGPAGRHEHHRPPAESVFAQLVAQRLAPELRRPPNVADAKSDQSYIQHTPILATAPLSRNGYPFPSWAGGLPCTGTLASSAQRSTAQINILNCRRRRSSARSFAAQSRVEP